MADNNRPILCGWDGEAFFPASPFWAKAADKQFVVGEIYPIEVHQERSAKSHRHYFAAVAEAHANLPEYYLERFSSPEALRKFALIKAGYRDERSIVCASKAEAQRLAAFIRPMDDFCIVTVSEAVVVAYTAKSQSLRAMGKKDFQASKTAVLDIVSQLVGVTATELQVNAGQAA
jgi:hypothetical protein